MLSRDRRRSILPQKNSLNPIQMVTKLKNQMKSKTKQNTDDYDEMIEKKKRKHSILLKRSALISNKSQIDYEHVIEDQQLEESKMDQQRRDNSRKLNEQGRKSVLFNQSSQMGIEYGSRHSIRQQNQQNSSRRFSEFEKGQDGLHEILTPKIDLQNASEHDSQFRVVESNKQIQLPLHESQSPSMYRASKDNAVGKSLNTQKKQQQFLVKGTKLSSNLKSSLLGSITNALENIQSVNEIKTQKLHIQRTITTKKKRDSQDIENNNFDSLLRQIDQKRNLIEKDQLSNNLEPSRDWSIPSEIENEAKFGACFNVSFPLEFYKKSDQHLNIKIDVDSPKSSMYNLKQSISQMGSQSSNPSTNKKNKKNKIKKNLLLNVNNTVQFRVTAFNNHSEYLASNMSKSEQFQNSNMQSQDKISNYYEASQKSSKKMSKEYEDQSEYIDEYYDADPIKLLDKKEINEVHQLDEVEEIESDESEVSSDSETESDSDSILQTRVPLPDFIQDYELLAQQDPYNDFYPLIMIQNHNFSWVWKECTSYQDNYPLLFFRKIIFLFIECLYVISNKLISSKYWVLYTLSVSIANIILFLNQRYRQKAESKQISEELIIALFAFEEFVKVMGHGTKRYVSNLWNFYDLIILILYTFHHFDPHLIFNVSPFRIIRIPFYLAELSRGLNIMLTSLQESFKSLMETFLVLLIFTGFFTLITLHLFTGLLRYQCFDPEVGIFIYPLHVCGFSHCHQGHICLKNTINPEAAENWDDFFFAYINIIKTATMIDMHYSMFELMNAFHPSIFILFLVIIFVIDKFLFQLIIALLKTQYRESTQIFESNQFHEKQQEKSVRLNVRILMDLNLYQELKLLKNSKPTSNQNSQSAEISNNQSQNKMKIVKKIEEKEKKNEIKLLSARQQNMLENYKRKMQMQHENTSWVNSWLFPDQKIKQRMTQLIKEQENFFLQYYDLQIYYRFRSTDFLSLSLYLKPEKDLFYTSTSEKQVLEKKEVREKQKFQNLLRLKQLDFKYKLENTQMDFQRRFKPSKVRLPLLDREMRNLPQYVYTVTPPPDVEIQERYQMNIQKSSSPSINQVEKSEKVNIRNTNNNNKSFKQFVSFKNIQIDKLFEKNEQPKNNTHNELSESILEEDKEEENQVPEIIITEKKNNLIINGEEKSYDDLIEIIAQPIEQVEEKKILTDYQEKYEKIRYYDMQNGVIDCNNWSGGTVLQYSGYANRLGIIIQAINSKQYKMMFNFLFLVIYRLNKLVTFIAQLKFISVFYDICIVINTILVSLVGLIDDVYIQQFSNSLNYILTWELLIKIIADKKQAQQFKYIIQSIIILLCDASMVIKHNIHLIDEYYDWIELLKVLFFFRILKYNKLARKLYQIAQMTYHEYIYLAILMFFLILNISVVGIQIFGDHFPQKTERGQLFSFADVQKSWFAVFVLMTMDDWFGIMIMSYEHHLSKIASIGFCLFLIFILNYLMKELLMAMILEGFGEKLFEKNKDNFENIEEDYNDQEALEEAQIKTNENQDEDLLAIIPIETTEEENQQDYEEMEKQKLKQQNPNQYSINYFRKVESNRKKHFFRVANILDKLTNEQIVLQIYDNLECKQSFFHFDKKHPFRIFCYNFLQNRLFNYISQIVLMISLVNMIFITYQQKNKTHQYSDPTVLITLITNIFIFCESLIRMVAYGVIMDSDSLFTDYLRGIDFIYCFFSLLSQFYTSPQIEFLCMLGYIRPLRILSIFETFKLEKIALFQSITQIWEIAFLLLAFWFIFGIFGVWLFQGKMSYCEELMEFHINEEECLHEGKKWITNHANFENILQAMSTLFQLASFDYMGEILVGCINGTEHGPIQDSNEIISYIFFVPFLFFGGHFFLGIFAAVIYMNFKLCKETFVYGDLTQDQINFLKISEIILQEDPSYSDPPRSWFRIMTQQIISNKFYHGFIILILALNIFILAMFYQDQTYQYAMRLNYLHHACSFVFLIDVLLKVTTYHVIRYLSYFWRLIELGLCLLSFFDFLLDMTHSWFEFYLTANISDPLFKPVRILFILRDLRVLLIIQEFIGIQRLLHVITFSLGSLMKILFFYVLVIFVYAFIGCQLFGQIDQGQILTNQLNFNNFFNAVITLYKVTTKNHWRLIYMDSTYMNPYCQEDPNQCGQPIIISVLFYFSFLILSNYILLNIFILTLVDNFDSFFSSTSSIIETYIENLDKFKNVWCKYSYEKKGKKMHTKYLAHFLLQLGEPLGCQTGDNVWDVAKNASNFKIKCDSNGYVHFNELLYESVKYGFKERLFKGGTYEGFRQLKMHDKKVRYRLHQMRDQGQRRAVLNHIVKLRGNFNILQEYLYVLMAIKTWKSFTKQFIENANLTDSQDFTEKTEVQSSDSIISLENSISLENEDSQQIQQISPASNEDSFKDLVDIPIYSQKPDHIFKISFLNRIYVQKFKDKVILTPLSG